MANYTLKYTGSQIDAILDTVSSISQLPTGSFVKVVESTLTSANMTEASNGAISEGSGIATGDNAHAEGFETVASGAGTHAEGYKTISYDYYSHAEGSVTQATSYGAHAEGNRTQANGEYSHAEGNASQANGEGSHAEGACLANGNYSHAEGFSTYANGDYSHTEGAARQADGVYSHAEGCNTIAQGSDSHAEGRDTKAIGDHSHTEGKDTEASGEGAHAEGKGTIALGGRAHAEGGSTKADGSYSHAEGYATLASGQFAHAEGYNKDDGGTPIGEGASGNASHSEGYKTSAIGIYAHAEGEDSIAVGEASHAEGGMTQGNGQFAHAEGYLTVASGNYSHTEGQGTVANKNWQSVRGKYNILDTLSSSQYVDIIGWGNSDTERANLYALDASGNLHIYGDVYERCNADSTGGSRLYDKYVKNQQPDTDIGKTLVVGSNGRVVCRGVKLLNSLSSPNQEAYFNGRITQLIGQLSIAGGATLTISIGRHDLPASHIQIYGHNDTHNIQVTFNSDGYILCDNGIYSYHIDNLLNSHTLFTEVRFSQASGNIDIIGISN